MSKRLQVVVDDAELEEIQAAARRHGVTASEWVRRVLRDARRAERAGDPGRKLAAIRAGAAHSFPAPDIDTMIEEIEQGYRADGGA